MTAPIAAGGDQWSPAALWERAARDARTAENALAAAILAKYGPEVFRAPELDAYQRAYHSAVTSYQTAQTLQTVTCT